MEYKNLIRNASLAGLFSLVIVACGGSSDGGGGGSGSNSVTYTGNTAPANITEANSREIAATGTATNSAPPITPLTEQSSYGKGKFVMQTLNRYSKILAKSVETDALAFGNNPGVAVIINENFICSVSGNINLAGTIDDQTLIGNLTYSFNNCNDGTVTTNGAVSLIIDGYDLNLGRITDGTFIYNNLHFASNDPALGIDLQIGATLRFEFFYTGNFNPSTDRTTIDMVLADNISGESIQFDNFVTEVVFSTYIAPVSRTESINGRFYEHVNGYVDINTVTPLVYSNITQGYPDSGGPIIFTGESNKKVKITPVSVTLVNLSADLDGDDFYEYSITLTWLALNSAESNTNAPVADTTGSDTSILLTETAQLDASNSTDADFNLLTFSWTVTDQPVGSNAGLAGANAVNPTLTPDALGTYTVEVEVSDGTFTSTDTVVVTVN